MNGIAPGLDGFLAQRQMAGREQTQQLGQMQGLLGIQQAMGQQQQLQKDQHFKGLLGQKLREGDKEGATGILMQWKPELFAAQLAPKPQEAFTLAPGAVRYGPDGKQIAAAPVDNKIAPNGQVYNPRAIQPGQSFQDPSKLVTMGPDGKPMVNPIALQARTQIAAAGKPSMLTKINMAQETEENKAIGKELGQQYAGIQSSGMQAPTRISKLQRMAQLSEGVTTGALTPALTDVAALADSLGVKVDKNLGSKQAFEALSNEVALSLRSTGDGGGMPGAMSDKDREFLKAMTPSLSKTPEGNKLIIESGIKLEQRKQQVAQMAREYRAKNRTLEGFSSALQKWSDANPIFTAPDQGKSNGVKFLGFE